MRFHLEQLRKKQSGSIKVYAKKIVCRVYGSANANVPADEVVTYLGESTCTATAEKWSKVTGGAEPSKYWETGCKNVTRDDNTGAVTAVLPCPVDKDTPEVPDSEEDKDCSHVIVVDTTIIFNSNECDDCDDSGTGTGTGTGTSDTDTGDSVIILSGDTDFDLDAVLGGG